MNDTLRYKILLPGAGSKEYFLLENRQQISFDRNIPGPGLLILHCDDNLSGSNDMNQGHWHVSVEQADGLNHLENGTNEGDANDVFPGPMNLHTEFTNLTNPSTASYYGIANQAAVWNVRQDAVAHTVTFNLGATFNQTSGDVVGDGSISVADVVFLLNYIFMGGAAPQPVSLGDADCSGSINIADVVYLIAYIFSGGAAPCSAF
ncbi:MAG: hypothetical protein E4G91_04825 [Candidatus Zixiibacteriota bacterium]|nr:MAG: hypothetical protein E4G91_04825 [candidate division Zixibacteria bacterium]